MIWIGLSRFNFESSTLQRESECGTEYLNLNYWADMNDFHLFIYPSKLGVNALLNLIWWVYHQYPPFQNCPEESLILLIFKVI